jgi:hypothetical protein
LISIPDLTGKFMFQILRVAHGGVPYLRVESEVDIAVDPVAVRLHILAELGLANFSTKYSRMTVNQGGKRKTPLRSGGNSASRGKYEP